MQWPSHGGRPEQLLARFGLAADREILDFSANINPLGPPAWLKDRLIAGLDGLDVYPDPGYLEARCAIAEAENLDSAQVLLTNGGAEAVFLAARLHAGQTATIVQPTFVEYERACRHYGLRVADLPLSPDNSFSLDETRASRAMEGSDVLFVCRPNNPTGTLIERSLVERLLEAGRRLDCTLVVDEAFVDFLTDPVERLTPLLARYPNLILLRSMTKLYAIPGLRLGYLLGSPEVVRHAAALQMPWSVNSLAAALVEPLLADSGFVARTHRWLQEERLRLHEAFARLGFQVTPSQVNFLLLRDARCPSATGKLFEFLLHAGILARHTHNFRGLDGAWLRLAVRSREDNGRLLAALGDWSPAG
ncbi:threonine-phosphate decarboxylase CobD [Litchfieldella rifensis]|uniref:threonine-phosphate decarboxylase n=1 Tax=Litchfieldella rifensis TaxID=762643 RepID=A0ABV7LMB1_9GAMM